MKRRSFLSSFLALASASSTSAPPTNTGRFEPPITGQPQLPGEVVYTVWDGNSGVTPRSSSALLGLEWDHYGTGDWIDAKGTPQGSALFGQTAGGCVVGQYNALDIAALAQRLIAVNKGIYLKYVGAFGTLGYAGRLSENPPKLVIVTDAGTFDCRCKSSAWWSTSAPGSFLDGTLSARFDHNGSNSILGFDLTGVAGTVSSATLSLYIKSASGRGLNFGVLEAAPKAFMMGAGSYAPTPGLAAEVGEANLAAHPDVLMAGDFTGASKTRSGEIDVFRFQSLFNRGGGAGPGNESEFLPDPDAPGTVMFRGSFKPPATRSGTSDAWRAGFSATHQLQSADTRDPLRPAAGPVPDDLYYRMYIMLEDDWQGTTDGNKMGITWDCRMGWWNNSTGGYWQNVSGNGGTPGSGKKEIRDIKSHGRRCVYQGHMLRMVVAPEPTSDNPLIAAKSFGGYNYDIPLWEKSPNGGYPPIITYGGTGSGPNGKQVKFAKGRPYCIEQHLKLNTIDLSAPDAMGNGVARADGLLETWINGVLVDQRTDLRLRAHPEMGIAAVNANWYYGGVGWLNKQVHFRMNHLVLARRYIGPRVKPTAPPAARRSRQS